jgi:hypothetical protein
MKNTRGRRKGGIGQSRGIKQDFIVHLLTFYSRILPFYSHVLPLYFINFEVDEVLLFPPCGQ